MTIQPPTFDETVTLFYSGSEKREAGVGFMVDARAISSVIAFHPLSDRLAVLTINGTIKTHIISAYAPTETGLDPVKDDFYNQLQHALDSIPQTEVIILAGDFNAHIGVDRSGWEATMGKFGHGKINDNGLRLLSFAASNNLIIGNSYFQHPEKHQLTWRNPSGKDSAILDYILINARFRSSLMDTRAMRGPDCGSDHYFVRARVQLKLRRAKRSPRSAKLDWRQLTHAANKQVFQIALSNRFEALAVSEDIDEEEKQISDVILECAKPLCPPVRRHTQPWISDECLDLVNKRKQAKLVDFEQYRQLNRQVRLRMKAEREAYWNQVAADLEVAASKHEYHTLYRTLRSLSGKTKSTSDNIKNADGTFVRSPSERLIRWSEFFKALYNHDAPPGPAAAAPPIDSPPEVPMFDAEPTVEEVKAAIRSLRNGKAPGVDQVTTEAIKAGGDVLLHRLHSLFQTIWHTEQIPLTWKKAIIVPILKKGDNRECKNYRGISLLSIVGKVFMKIIQSRLQKHREQTSREEQAGFRPGRGCCDQIFAIRQLMEERIRCGQRTIVVFIDFKSAFDCVHWPALWNSLEVEHVPRKVITLLQTAYMGSTSQVRIRNDLSEEFTIQTGVRQGDVVSPLLFNIVVDAIMRKALSKRRGVQYGENHYVTDLMFADDSAIFADNDAEATDILYDIARIAQPYGLKINADKTKVLTTDGSWATVHLEGVRIEQVQNFKYLGSLVQEKKVASTSEIHSRIGQAAAAFAQLKWCLWKKTNISTKTKIRLFRTLILPILLYGSETWTCLKPDLNKLEVFQMRCLRQILGLSLRDGITNDTIRARCQLQPSIADQIQKRRLRWFGHVCRMGANRIPSRLIWRQRPAQWRIHRAAPRKTWAKHVEDDLKSQRLDLNLARTFAMDRKAWKNITEQVRNPAAPTAVYWLRGKPPPPVTS